MPDSKVPFANAILCYHRVTKLQPDPFSLAIQPNIFRSQIAYLARHYEVVPLADILQPPGHRRKPRIALTFDDGYLDSLTTIASTLQEFQLPATFFIPLCALDSRREFWWDALSHIFLECRKLPNSPIPIPELASSLPALSKRVGPFERLSVARWRYGQSRPNSVRALAFQRCYDFLLKSDPADIEYWIDNLYSWASITPSVRQNYQRCSIQDLRTLAVLPGVSIGAHTVTHPALASLAPEDASREMLLGKRELDRLLGTSISALAYPYGGAQHLSREVIKKAELCGYAYSCSTIPGLVGPNCNRQLLPRLIVRNLSRRKFASWLTWQFENLKPDSPPRELCSVEQQIQIANHFRQI